MLFRGRRPAHASPPALVIVILTTVLSGSATGRQEAQGATPSVLHNSRHDTVTVIADPGQAAGPFHRMLYGSLHRDLWTTPVRLPVLHLTDLTPVKTGGGFQTRSLFFQAGTGEVFAFRSVNRDPDAPLPFDLNDSFAEYLARTATGAVHPAAVLIVDSLAGALGLPRLYPRMVFLPDDARLGEFRTDFGGSAGILERVPDPGPAGFSDIRNTYRLFDEMRNDSRNRVDERTFLRARLLDLLTGDWNRDITQWRWGTVDNDCGTSWYPVPVNHDQAFVRLDGLFPRFASMMAPHIEGFDDALGGLSKLTSSALLLDRRLLAELDRPAWDSVVAGVVACLSDSVLKGAAGTLPPEYAASERLRVFDALRQRRETIREASRKYYNILAEHVDINLSARYERTIIRRLPDGRVSVTSWQDCAPRDTVFQRVFDPSDTEEIRVYTMGGGDTVTIEGDSPESIAVQVVRSEASDTLRDPDPAPTAAANNNDDAPVPAWRQEFARRYERPRDYGREWVPGGYVSLTRENGLVLGGGPVLYRYGFRSYPYLYRMELFGALAFPDLRWKLSYGLQMPALAEHLSLEAYAHHSQLESRRWYGLGNDTPRDLAVERDRGYEVQGREFAATVHLFRSVGKVARIGLGASLSSGTLKPAASEQVPGLFPPGFGELRSFGGGGLLFRLDTRDDPILPRSGVFIETGGWAYAGLLRNLDGYQRLTGDLRVIAGGIVSPDAAVAFRIGGVRLFGDIPEYSVASVGGQSLRGFPTDRFAGDASLHASAELRVSLGRRTILLPTEFGLLLGFDAGRVWLRGSSPGSWHTSPVLGMWGAPIDRRLLMSASVASSSEGWELRLNTGLDF